MKRLLLTTSVFFVVSWCSAGTPMAPNLEGLEQVNRVVANLYTHQLHTNRTADTATNSGQENMCVQAVENVLTAKGLQVKDISEAKSHPFTMLTFDSTQYLDAKLKTTHVIANIRVYQGVVSLTTKKQILAIIWEREFALDNPPADLGVTLTEPINVLINDWKKANSK